MNYNYNDISFYSYNNRSFTTAYNDIGALGKAEHLI